MRQVEITCIITFTSFLKDDASEGAVILDLLKEIEEVENEIIGQGNGLEWKGVKIK